MEKGPDRRTALGWMAKGLAGGLAGSSSVALSGCGPRKQVLRPNLIIWHGFRGAEKASLEKLAAIYSSRLRPGQRPVRAVAIPSDAMADKISASVPRGKGPDLFGSDSLKLIAEASEGLTRRINIFADKTLLAAFAAGTHTVTADHVRAAISDTQIVVKSAGPRRAALVL